MRCLFVLFLSLVLPALAAAEEHRAPLAAYDRGCLIVAAGIPEGLALDDELYLIEHGIVITNPLTGREEEVGGNLLGVVTVVAFREEGARSVSIYEGEYIDVRHPERYFVYWEDE